MGTRENFAATTTHLKAVSTEEDAVFSGATVPPFKFPAGSAEGLRRGHTALHSRLLLPETLAAQDALPWGACKTEPGKRSQLETTAFQFLLP